MKNTRLEFGGSSAARGFTNMRDDQAGLFQVGLRPEQRAHGQRYRLHCCKLRQRCVLWRVHEFPSVSSAVLPLARLNARETLAQQCHSFSVEHVLDDADTLGPHGCSNLRGTWYNARNGGRKRACVCGSMATIFCGTSPATKQPIRASEEDGSGRGGGDAAQRHL